jgi:hypothetical protein
MIIKISTRSAQVTANAVLIADQPPRVEMKAPPFQMLPHPLSIDNVVGKAISVAMRLVRKPRTQPIDRDTPKRRTQLPNQMLKAEWACPLVIKNHNGIGHNESFTVARVGILNPISRSDIET